MNDTKTDYVHFSVKRKYLYALLLIAIVLPVTVVAAAPQTVKRAISLAIWCSGNNQVAFDQECLTTNVHYKVYRAGALFDQSTGECIANCFVKQEIQYAFGIFPYFVNEEGYMHNILTNQGKNIVKSDLGALGGNSNQSAPIIIILGNASMASAAAGDNYCCAGSNMSFVGGSIGTSSGLDPSSGSGSNTVSSTGGGTWTVVKTFTLAVAASATIYGAGLITKCCGSTTTYGGAGSVRNTQPNPTGYLFAEAAFGSSVTLNTGDSLQVTWSMTAS